MRASCDPALGTILGECLLDVLPPPVGAVVAGTWPMTGEIDLRPLLHGLHERGHRVVLPETSGRGTPLIFRHWWPGCVMIAERFGTWRPDGPVLDPDVILVPLLGFDRTGHRLGYGGGYYDRTLAARPQAMAIGCGFAVLELDAVPASAHDARLDAVATERGVRLFERRN